MSTVRELVRLGVVFLMAMVIGACQASTPSAVDPGEVDPTVGSAGLDEQPGTPAVELDPTVEPSPAPAATDQAPESAAATPLPDPASEPGAAPASDVPAGGVPAPGDPSLARVELQQIAVLDQPISIAIRGGDERLWVAERPGRVRPVGADGVVGPPVIDLTDDTTTDGERGLLAIDWSPDGSTLYLSSTDASGATVLQAADVEGGVLKTPRTILRVDQPASNHNGGDLHVGTDGVVWWSLGDGGASNDRFGNGQRPDTLLGTLVRIDPTTPPYAIPADNPFADGDDGAPEVWAYGLRNPWRFSIDDATRQLWIADVGQNAVEEINRVPLDAAGLNYGWPSFEGDEPFDGTAIAGPHQPPVHTYRHDRGCSITGGVVYRGSAIPDLNGAYLYSDYCNGDIYALQVNADGTIGDDVRTGLSAQNVVSFGTDAEGEVIVASLAGPLYRIVPS